MAEEAITIIDGQNETQINTYIQLNNTNQWDPCLPKPFDATEITVLFDPQHIKDLNDWYPTGTCGNNNNTMNYRNEYFFDGKSLIIYNLIINNYVIAGNINKNYLLVKSSATSAASIYCYNCTFMNISSSHRNPLFDTLIGIQLRNSHFINITTNTSIIETSIDSAKSQSQELQGYQIRQFFMLNTTFFQIVAVSIIDTTLTSISVKPKHMSQMTMIFVHTKMAFYGICSYRNLLEQKYLFKNVALRIFGHQIQFYMTIHSPQMSP